MSIGDNAAEELLLVMFRAICSVPLRFINGEAIASNCGRRQLDADARRGNREAFLINNYRFFLRENKKIMRNYKINEKFDYCR